jgi:hypothetical protein
MHSMSAVVLVSTACMVGSLLTSDWLHYIQAAALFY